MDLSLACPELPPRSADRHQLALGQSLPGALRRSVTVVDPHVLGHQVESDRESIQVRAYSRVFRNARSSDQDLSRIRVSTWHRLWRLQALVQVLGRSSPEMTMRQAHLASPTLRVAYEQAIGKLHWRIPVSSTSGRAAVPDSVEWLNSEMFKTRVAHGYCSRDLAAGISNNA